MAFSLFRDHTTDTPATYTGVNGHTYAFFSVARDHVGNTQSLPSAAQTSTTVDTVLPAVATVLSRKAHGGAPRQARSLAVRQAQALSEVEREPVETAGTFDLPLSLGASATIEPRTGGPDTLVFTFSENIKVAAGAIGTLNFTIANAAFNLRRHPPCLTRLGRLHPFPEIKTPSHETPHPHPHCPLSCLPHRPDLSLERRGDRQPEIRAGEGGDDGDHFR